MLQLKLALVLNYALAISWQDEYSARPLPAFRDYELNDYIVVKGSHKPAGAVEAIAIKDHWVVEKPRTHGLYKREYSRIQKRASVNGPSSQLDSQSCCVPPRLSKRAEDSLASVREEFNIQDPLFGQQWHLYNAEIPGHDMNVLAAWRAGFTGKNVTVAIVDDGLDYNHPDFATSFSLEGSYDYNKHRQEPTPELYDDWHGTRCAGEIAANLNDVCGVGIAPDAKVAGIRILSGALTSLDEARALNHMMHENDIYSCSWGPADDGQQMEGPPDIVRRAIINGIEYGRGGLGSIYMQAAGNGYRSSDNCNYDGYTNSIYSITVSSVDVNNKHPFYAESCSSNFITTYSSNNDLKITSTDPLSQHKDDEKNSCTDAHTGTSASAPMAAGIMALVLEARPELSWRDVQYVCREAAVPFEIADVDERGNWTQVADNKFYHNDYGFGLLDAGRAVEAAQKHELVKPQTWFFSTPKEHHENFNGLFESSIEVTESDLADMARLEHANVRLSYQFQKRGALRFTLVSPEGLPIVLADARRRDNTGAEVNDWTFNSVAHWGQNPVGTWTLRVENVSGEELPLGGLFKKWSIRLWGESKGNEKRLYSDMWDEENKPISEHEKSVLESPIESASSEAVSSETGSISSTTSSSAPTSSEPEAAETTSSDSTAANSPAPTSGYAEQDQPGHFTNKRHGVLFYVVCSAIGISIIMLGVVPVLYYVLKRRRDAVAYDSLNTGLLTAEDIELEETGHDSFEISDEEPLRPIPQRLSQDESHEP